MYKFIECCLLLDEMSFLYNLLKNPYVNKSSSARVQAILHLLEKCPDEAYFSFREAIIKIGRQDVVDEHLPVLGNVVDTAAAGLPGASTSAARHAKYNTGVQGNSTPGKDSTSNDEAAHAKSPAAVENIAKSIKGTTQ